MLNYKKLMIIAIIGLPTGTLANKAMSHDKYEGNEMSTAAVPIKKIENLFQKTKKTLLWKIFIKSANRR